MRQSRGTPSCTLGIVNVNAGSGSILAAALCGCVAAAGMQGAKKPEATRQGGYLDRSIVITKSASHPATLLNGHNKFNGPPLFEAISSLRKE